MTETYQIPGEDGRLQAWTVRELREVLADPSIPNDMLVVLSSDAEGNEHHPMMEMYAAKTDEYITMRGHKAGEPCIVLVPMD